MAAPRGALAGVRVLDLSRVLAGPYCAQLLADHGADVVKVESPAGDDTRSWGPPFLDDGTSAYYANLNRDKRNVVLDLSRPAGREVLARLLADADVLLENFKAGTLEKWGFDRAYMKEHHRRLVHCRITGFGVDGPLGGLPGYDAVLQAYSGLMSVNGEADGPALRVGVPMVDMVTGILAFSGVLLALRERDRSGFGQLVDLTLLDTAITLLHPHSASWLADGTIGGRTGSAHPSIAPYETFTAADGPFFVSAGNDRQFADLVDALGEPALAADARFSTNSDRVRNVAELRAALQELIVRHRREDLAAVLLARGVPASPVNDVGQALSGEQVRHREMVVEREGYRGIGIPIKLERSPGRVGPGPRPHGADTRAVLDAAGFPGEQIEEALRAGVAQEATTAPDGPARAGGPQAVQRAGSGLLSRVAYRIGGHRRQQRERRRDPDG